MRPDLLDILADPLTGQPLALRAPETHADEIVGGWLESYDGARRYPIVRGIPRFVDHGYAESFGLQWTRYATTQLDSHTGVGYSRRRLEAEVPWLDLLGRTDWVLDAGCGAGRFAEVASTFRARVVALDLSRAVDAAAAHLEANSRVQFVQADLMRPPIQPGKLAGVYSIGVLQHTPDPLGAVAKLARLPRAQGRFAFTIYARRPWTRLYAKYLVRPLTRRLPPALLLALVERSMPILFPATEVLFRLPALGRIARFALPVANYVEKRDFSRQQRFEEAILDTFDMLSPRYDNPVTAEEVARALATAGVAAWTFQSRVPVNVVGTR